MFAVDMNAITLIGESRGTYFLVTIQRDRNPGEFPDRQCFARAWAQGRARPAMLKCRHKLDSYKFWRNDM